MSWFYWVTFFSLGYFTFHQILQQQYFHRTISQKTLEAAQIFFPPIYLVILYFFKTSLVSLVIIHLILVSSELILITLSYRKRLQLFSSRLIAFLDEIILSLSLGNSLINAIVTIKEKKFFYSCIDFREIIDSFTLSPLPKDNKVLIPQALYLWENLKEIHESRHQVRNKVMALRQRLWLQQRLQEKTSIGLAQARAQWQVASLLYLVLIVVTTLSKSSFLVTPYFFVSLVLFLIGGYLLHKLSGVQEVVDDVVRVSQEMIYLLQSGQGVAQSLGILTQKIHCSHFKNHFAIWAECLRRGMATEPILSALNNSAQRQLLTLLERGFRGEPIAPILNQFHKEVLDQNLSSFERQISLLPLKGLIPLLIFIFPAYLIVLFVPLLMDVQDTLKIM
ncbi:MAG: hypothetical protein NZ480_00335 [Bdellovibrionaceae bacterium]|nr:hypothetical protein [Pseudobdellovibrionaceae bacterium]MDW8190146.1 hypothetical protein [Pseudobdellovibrionaceae bacterium]